jgi:hypothetical protein
MKKYKIYTYTVQEQSTYVRTYIHVDGYTVYCILFTVYFYIVRKWV